MAGKAWTTKEVAYVRKNALLAETNEVLNVPQLAKKLDRTVAATTAKIYELRRDGELPPLEREKAFDSKGRPWIPEEEKRLVSMHKQGNTVVEIADALGRSKPSCAAKINRLLENGKIKKKKKESWTEKQVELLLESIEFDSNGYVSNYTKLAKVTGKQYAKVVRKVNRLRKEGRIPTNVKPGTTSLKSKESMKKFNDARFAQYAKKEDVKLEQPMQSRSVTAGSLSIESKEERVIHTVVIFAGVETHTYFSADGTKIVEIQKEPTPVPASVSRITNN